MEVEQISQLVGQPLTQVEFWSINPTGHVRHWEALMDEHVKQLEELLHIIQLFLLRTEFP